MSCSEWKEYKLEDLIISYNSKRKPLSSREREGRNGIYPYYGAQGIIDYLDDYIFDGEYLLIAEDGNNLRERKEDIARIAHGRFWVNNHAHIITNNHLSDMRFLKYYLNIVDISAYITGSAQPKLNKANLNNIKIKIPSLEKQKKIAKILSSLDDKIELNNEMNKTLEEMAQSIFKRWFVDFEFPNEDGEPYKSSGGEMVESELGMIPRGWEVKELGEVININPRESLKKGEEKIYVEMANLPLNYARVKNYIEKPFSGGTKFRNGDILLARITPCLENGKTAIVDFLEENDLAFGSTEYIVMRPKALNQYYIYCLARDEDFRNYAIKNMNGSSGRQRVDANTIKQYMIPCPDKDILEVFNHFCVSLFNQMKKNDDESNVLSNMRDTLLPKLMSGNISLK